MSWLRSLAISLGVLLGGWLMFDGVRALTVGDYVTPTSGDYAGQLGPWSQVVAAVGVEPRSSLMKGTHVLLGGFWLLSAGGFAIRRSWAWPAMAIAAGTSLWYLPLGTLIGVIELALLLGPLRRQAQVAAKIS
jgi:hypothetical protein